MDNLLLEHTTCSYADFWMVNLQFPVLLSFVAMLVSTHDCYVECKIGHAMSDILGVVRLNNLPHAQNRCPFYEIIKKYNLQSNKLAGCKVRKAYDRIIGVNNTDRPNSNMLNQWKSPLAHIT